MILPAAMIALTSWLGVSAAQGADSEVPVETYQLSDGTNCFLVPLQAEEIASDSDYVDVVALIDFSASQLNSQVRKTTQETVASLVANLPKNARVQLFSVSNVTEPITDGFLAVGSKELTAAVNALAKRDALGAADLEESFKVAVDAFDYNDAADRSIVFVGRGVSTGAAFNEEVFEETVGRLVDARVPVNAYGVGANVNEQTLGALANRTGGYVVESSTEAKDAGKELAKATTASVFFPEVDSLDIAGSDLYPNPLPPIRSDRETYLVGSASEELKNLNISIPVSLADGREADIEWSLAPQKSSKSNQYLYQLVQAAQSNGGATLSIAGRAMLTDQQVAINSAVDQTLELAEQAKEAGDTATAARLSGLVQEEVDLSLNDDQDELDAEVADDTTDDQTVAEPAQNAPATELEKRYAAAESKDRKTNNQANLLEAAESNVKVNSAAVKTHARVVAENARKNSMSDPDGELQHIKTEIEAIENNSTISPDLRATLLSELAATGRFVRAQKEQRDVNERAAQVNQAIVASHERARIAAENDQIKVVEIMKRFESLVKQSKYILAAEAAKEAADVSPDSALPTQAWNVVVLHDALTENHYLRHVRQKKLLDTLMSVERAHVPVSDEPPIAYPDPEVWVNLTKVRKAKYGQANLTGSAEEQRIAAALETKVDVEGGEDAGLTLTDWIDSVKEQLHEKNMDINVVFDTTNIEEAAGAPSSLEINETLSNISLRKALKIVLRPHDLAFCILNDALYITTQDEIKNNPEISTSLQLYSVGDLIMQPNQNGSMGGMGGGMMGGMGGMMGGMGGGMMGGMGGFGGGMMGGGRGGMFSVPNNNRQRAGNVGAANDAILKNFIDAPEVPAAADGGLFAVPSKSNKTTAKPATAKPVGTLAQAPVDLNAKYDAWFEANAPKEPSENASEEATAAYQKERERFANELVIEAQKLVNSDAKAAVAFLKSAMRNDCADSWMYEALVAALIKSDAPRKEIEKAVLSVADFNGDPLVLMGLAAYLEKIGSKERALKIYRDVARVAPTRPEPYVHGLALAQELNDEEAQKWVTLGIASVVWDGKLVEDVQRPGYELAEELYERMKTEGRDEDAEAYKAKFAEATVRDVIVEISWAGDAEIDLAVKEPTSAVCWYAQRRTAAGGTLLDTTNDVRRAQVDLLKDKRSQTYVCPMGFSGQYDFLIKKSWGDLAQNKVTVLISTNVGTKNQHQNLIPVELNDEGKAEFTVDLAEGRRLEEEKEEILNAAAMIEQMQIRTNAELSKLAKAAESRVAHNENRASGDVQSKASEYASSYKRSDSKEIKELDEPQITYLEPDPGYYPVISTTYTGAGFTTSAGISGDRRYVLVAPSPTFSQLLKMFTYNSQDGGSYGGNGGGYGGNSGGYGGGGYGGGMGGYGGGMMGGGMGGYGGGMGGMMGGGMGGMMGGMGGGMRY